MWVWSIKFQEVFDRFKGQYSVVERVARAWQGYQKTKIWTPNSTNFARYIQTSVLLLPVVRRREITQEPQQVL